MKVIILIILGYTIYLNNKQTTLLKEASQTITSQEVQSQLNMNIICSYVFTIFIGLLFIFVIKSFFS
jgi:heme/copper-type cytochrome/quinol oxidase subunit 2